MFAGLFASAALFLVLNEGIHNWQSLWTAVAFVLFGSALWPRHLIAVWSMLSLPQPEPQASTAGGFVAVTSKVESDK